ncbi:hypothetical protein GCM10007862_17540 [Dyella lipolytica]|nr:hypothetical protein GCM10007862_17540 [Dyella lipolytica]
MYQSDLGYTNYTVGLQIVPDVLPSADGINQVPVTISVASPAVVTLASHGFTANMGVSFGGTGTLPTGITAGTTYYILSAGLTPNTFEISSTLGGSPINTTGSFVAPIDALPSYPGDFAEAIGASVHGHQWWTGTLIRRDTIAAGGVAHQDYGGSVSVDAPAAWAQVSGDWVTGLDLSAGTYSSTYAIKLPDLTGILFGSTSSIYDNGGTMFVAAPTQVQGTLKATGSITGTFVRPIMTTLASLSSTVDPSPQAGDQAAISDAVACTANSPVTGGASTSCAVVYSGTQWKAVVSH